MAVRKIPFVVNVRKNNNMNSSTYGCYYPVADTKKTLDLKGFARHMVDHGKRTDYADCVQFLVNVVDCLQELLLQNQSVKLDGLGTFTATIQAVKGGKQSIEALVADLENSIKGVHVRFIPENAGDQEDKLTSVSMKDKCAFTAGYSLTTYKVTNSKGKQVSIQKKVNLESVLNPQPENNGGGGEGGNG